MRGGPVGGRDTRASEAPLLIPDDMDAPESYRLSTAALVHPAAGLAYVASRNGGVEALRLQTGESLWASGTADRPLAAAGTLLVAQARQTADEPNSLRIVIIDDEGEEVAVSDPLTMESWVRPEVWNNGDIYQFSCEGRIHEDRVLVSWHARTRRAPSPIRGGKGTGADRATGGRAWISPRTGRIVQETVWSGPERPASPPAGLKETLATLYPQHIQGTHLLSDRALTGIVKEAGDSGTVFLLRQWDAATAALLWEHNLTPADVNEAHYSSMTPRFSADGRHLLVTRLERKKRGEKGTRPYAHSVHRAAGGELAAEYPYLGTSPYPWPFVVAISNLVFVDGRGPLYNRDGDAHLVALNLEDGSRSWSKPLRKVNHHGMPASVP